MTEINLNNCSDKLVMGLEEELKDSEGHIGFKENPIRRFCMNDYWGKTMTPIVLSMSTSIASLYFSKKMEFDDPLTAGLLVGTCMATFLGYHKIRRYIIENL